jgi:hypothetical protein
MQEWSKEKESVAHHEAGHWVFAHWSNSSPEDIGLQWDDSERCWQGFSHGKLKADPREAIKIAFAGPWAEILFQARKKHPHATFALTDEPAVLISQVQNAEDEECDENNEIPVVALFLRGGASELFAVDPNAFSNDDKMACKLAQGDKNLIRELLLETRNQMIIDYPCWSDIERLAHELLRRLGDGIKVVITGDDAIQVVEQSTP